MNNGTRMRRIDGPADEASGRAADTEGGRQSASHDRFPCRVDGVLSASAKLPRTAATMTPLIRSILWHPFFVGSSGPSQPPKPGHTKNGFVCVSHAQGDAREEWTFNLVYWAIRLRY